jgi:hypothetical protein
MDFSSEVYVAMLKSTTQMLLCSLRGLGGAVGHAEKAVSTVIHEPATECEVKRSLMIASLPSLCSTIRLENLQFVILLA